ncbi:MAG: universal stress protein [Candidatus Competibacteraceae bacterium]|nr:universal stress protein [Candidatus Competibacteraceae bacterium]
MNPDIRTILYATDLGPRGPEVFAHAAAIARRFGAAIHIVHGVEPMGEFVHSLMDTYVPAEVLEELRQENLDQRHGEIQRRLEVFCRDELHTDTQESVKDVRVVEGRPERVILDEAARLQADMIVMGSRGHTALGEMLLGSVAHKVTLEAQVPVLLVPLRPQS